ncbi:hypothetical protein DSCO28_17400 [Desulfosarcina ovata subsp. sediminis]|uniref:NADH oxidase n=2 Tax=Desulfosarcina ovata TaxID=83564 RepID=A0A5K7ZIF6_9BACT|nr:hypothetical protein DSCO28_17400 [Desulfosarcina ovata subsp. sediminis]
MPAVALFYTKDYGFTDQYKAFYRERAKGGVGLMIIGPMAIDKVGSTPFIPGIFTDVQIDSLKKYIAELHQTSRAKIGVQLMHQGRYASEAKSGLKPIAPSAIASPLSREVPREMTGEDIETVKKAYVESALRAKEVGFDYIEILMAGGYLVGEFLSPLSNQRTDRYGGSLENRMRFGLEIIEKVRSAVGRNFALGIRVSGHDYMKGGNTLKESSRFCIEAGNAGVDAINVTGGWHETTVPQVTSEVPSGAFLYLSRAIKSVVRVPVFASNRLGDPVSAEKALRSGAADFICWARPLIADPQLPEKVRTGKYHASVPCIGCNQGCLDAIFAGAPVYCTVNPRVGREAITGITEASRSKKIYIAGGGPAGMQFALIANQRGHDVTLFEKDRKLGGQVNLIGAIPGKKPYLGIVSSLSTRLGHSDVKIKLNTIVTPERILREQPDVLVVATGALPASLNIKGANEKMIVDAWDVLDETVWDIGKRVVIIGGGATGCETALMVSKMGTPSAETISFLMTHSVDDIYDIKGLLCQTGRKITVVEISDRVAGNVGPSTRWALLKNMRLMGIKVITEAKVLKIEKENVYIETQTGIKQLPADTIIQSVGAISVNSLAQEVFCDRLEILTIGDAREARRLSDAIREGFDMAMEV